MPSVSQAQQRFFGIVRGIQKGEVPASYSPAAARVARSISAEDARDFAKTRRSGMPEHRRKGSHVIRQMLRERD